MAEGRALSTFLERRKEVGEALLPSLSRRRRQRVKPSQGERTHGCSNSAEVERTQGWLLPPRQEEGRGRGSLSLSLSLLLSREGEGRVQGSLLPSPEEEAEGKVSPYLCREERGTRQGSHLLSTRGSQRKRQRPRFFLLSVEEERSLGEKGR